jgi:hypothetical protein
METETVDNKTPILNIAWTRYAHFDALALERNRANNRLRMWIYILGILATLFAIVIKLFVKEPPENLVSWIIKGFFVAIPLVSSALALFSNKFYGSGDWLVMRAGAEQILREIYKYRTILQNDPRRNIWLEERLKDIQRQVFRGLGGEMVFKEYKGTIPPYDDPNNPNDDSGFNDLTGDQYFAFRVENQLGWHMRRLKQRQAERIRLTIYILAAGLISAFLAAIGGELSIWVALAASISAALVGWQELRNLDAVIKNYSKVQLELMVIYDHWNNLIPEERTKVAFDEMVSDTEELLWTQNIEYIKAMQEALAKNRPDDTLINEVMQKAIDEDQQMKDGMKAVVIEGTEQALHDAGDAAVDTYKKTYGSLAEEASSPLVQAELAAMKEAAAQTVETVTQSIITSVSASIQSVAAEFSGVKVDGDTPVGVLNDLISRYPVNAEPKG